MRAKVLDDVKYVAMVFILYVFREKRKVSRRGESNETFFVPSDATTSRTYVPYYRRWTQHVVVSEVDHLARHKQPARHSPLKLKFLFS